MFMRLPTGMTRNTADGRLVSTDLLYDLSGTRVYKRDHVRQESSAGKELISDRETCSLAHGSERLLEVQGRGPADPAREPQANLRKVAPDRYPAHIFGAGSRLARMSWDADGQVPVQAGAAVAVTNPDFENGMTGWSNVKAEVVSDPAPVPSRGSVLMVPAMAVRCLRAWAVWSQGKC